MKRAMVVLKQVAGTSAMLAVLGPVFLCATCSKDSQKSGSGPFPKPVLAKLGKEGFKVGDFKAEEAKPYRAVRCARGQVNDLDVLLCRYENEPAAEKAEARLLKFVGTALTGAIRKNGNIAMVVADHKKTDVKGKTINELLTKFASLKL